MSKLLPGRKRVVVCDTLGNWLEVAVVPEELQ